MNRAARIALHQSPREIVAAAVEACRSSLDVDAAFVATRDERGAFPVTHGNGVRDPRLLGIRIRPTVGLGGIVLAEARPFAVADYPRDPAISGDFKPIIASDGMRGLTCVPVTGPDGVAALLYAAVRRHGAPDGAAAAHMEEIGSYASIGLISVAARERARDRELLEQRQRLAMTLHDSVAQMLFEIGVAARRSPTERDPDVLAARLAEIETTAAAARSQLRETLARLTDLPASGAFEAVLEGEVRLFERLASTRVWTTRSGTARALPEHCESLVIDTAREALRNASKHGTRGHVLTHLGYQRESVVFCVQSTTPPDTPAEDLRERLFRAGSGLGLLRARAERARGTLDVTVDDAVTLRLELPSPDLTACAA